MDNKLYHHELDEIIKQIGRILATDGKNHPKNWEEIIESGERGTKWKQNLQEARIMWQVKN